MDLQKLKRFFTTVEYMSITKAAESLYITQPTLSKYISSLEDELGIKLFIRENQTLILTEAGKLLYKQGKTLMEQADSMIANLVQADTSARPKLNIVLERIHSERMFLLLKEVYEKHKEFEFNSRTITNNFNEIPNMVSSGNVEMGVVCCRSIEALNKDFSMIRLFSDSIVAVTSEEHRLSDRTAVSISELQNEDIVYPDCSDDMGDMYRQLCEKSGHNPDEMLFLDKEDQLSRVKWNFSISFCCKDTVGSDLPDCFKIIELDDIDTEISVVLLWRKNSTNPYVSTFIREIERFFPDYEWID